MIAAGMRGDEIEFPEGPELPERNGHGWPVCESQQSKAIRAFDFVQLLLDVFKQEGRRFGGQADFGCRLGREGHPGRKNCFRWFLSGVERVLLTVALHSYLTFLCVQETHERDRVPARGSCILVSLCKYVARLSQHTWLELWGQMWTRSNPSTGRK